MWISVSATATCCSSRHVCFPVRLTCPRHGFRWCPVAVVLPEWELIVVLRLREESEPAFFDRSPGCSPGRGCPRRFRHAVLVSPPLTLISPVQRLACMPECLTMSPNKRHVVPHGDDNWAVKAPHAERPSGVSPLSRMPSTALAKFCATTVVESSSSTVLMALSGTLTRCLPVTTPIRREADSVPSSAGLPPRWPLRTYRPPGGCPLKHLPCAGSRSLGVACEPRAPTPSAASVHRCAAPYGPLGRVRSHAPTCAASLPYTRASTPPR